MPISSPGLTTAAARAAAYGIASLNTGVGAITAASNVVALQSALTAAGEVRLVVPGTHVFSSVMYVPSFTSIYIGSGVELKVADGAPSALFTNSSARLTGITVAPGNANWVAHPDGVNYAIQCTGLAGAGVNFPVGSWVSAVITGHYTGTGSEQAANNRGFRGVWLVVASSANSITYEINATYPGGSASSTVPMKLYPANQGIRIWGPGKINGNGMNADAFYNNGDPRGNVIWWRHAYNVCIDGPHFERGRTWTIGSNYVRRYTVKNTTCELRQGTGYSAIDFIHLSGNHQTVLVDVPEGSSADNFVGMTVDITDDTSNSWSSRGNTSGNPTFADDWNYNDDATHVNYQQFRFNFPFQDPGEMHDVTVRDVRGNCASALGNFGVVAMYGPEQYGYHNIQVHGLAGAGSSGIQLSNYGYTGMRKLVIDKLVITNCSVLSGGGQVYMTAGTFDIGSIVIDRANGTREDVPLVVTEDATSGVIRSMRISNATFSPYNGVTYTRTVPMIKLGGVNINALNISDIETIDMAANVGLVQRTGSCVIGKMSLTDVSATGSGSGALFRNTGSGAAPTVQYTRARFNGVAVT